MSCHLLATLPLLAGVALRPRPASTKAVLESRAASNLVAASVIIQPATINNSPANFNIRSSKDAQDSTGAATLRHLK